MKIGLFSGTFDPVHEAHLQIARQAIDKLALDQVWFIPENQPRGKVNVTDVNHRLNMLNLATARDQDIKVFSTDSSFHNLETLRELKTKADHEFYILVGSDVVKHVDNWDDIDLIRKIASIVSFGRNGDRADIELDLPASSQKIQKAINAGNKPGYLPEDVLEYIYEHKLYQN